jgi:cell division septum initiation protein DivIVA
MEPVAETNVAAVVPEATEKPSIESSINDALSGIGKEDDGGADDVKEHVAKDGTEALADDPEFDIEVGGKPGKVKLSDLKKGYMQESDYTRKMQEFSKQREEISPIMEFIEVAKSNPKATEALVTFVEKFMGEKGVNEEFLSQFMGFVSGKNPVSEAAGQDPALVEALSGIDPESEVGKVLASVLTRNQALEKQFKELSEGLKTKEQREAESQHKQQFESAVQSARTFYTEHVKSLAGDKGQYKFETPDDQKTWEDLTHKLVAGDQNVVNSNQEFQAVIDKHAKAAYEYINGVRERALSKHLQTKRTPLPVDGAGGDRPPAGIHQKGLSIQDNIERLLNERQNGRND